MAAIASESPRSLSESALHIQVQKLKTISRTARKIALTVRVSRTLFIYTESRINARRTQTELFECVPYIHGSRLADFSLINATRYTHAHIMHTRVSVAELLGLECTILKNFKEHSNLLRCRLRIPERKSLFNFRGGLVN